jgi:hypothetical protein
MFYLEKPLSELRAEVSLAVAVEDDLFRVIQLVGLIKEGLHLVRDKIDMVKTLERLNQSLDPHAYHEFRSRVLDEEDKITYMRNLQST